MVNDDEFHIQLTLEVPNDSDGFFRRECPSCHGEFKRLYREELNPTVPGESDELLYCPRCGVAAGTDMWWTPAQIDHAQAAAGPQIDQRLQEQEQVGQMFKGMKGFDFTPDPNFTLGTPEPEPLVEPDDMVIVEPPCHPTEPIKVPDTIITMYCPVCGSAFV